MSYDLFFTSPEIGLKDFQHYFINRDNYRTEGAQALYQNEDTGVYFSFDFTASKDRHPRLPPGNLAFNLNYYRPHIFGIEAEPEVQAVVDYFGFAVHDPQKNGMGEGPYSGEAFLRGWNRGNEEGFRAVLNGSKLPATIFSLGSKRIHDAWWWNYARKANQRQLGEGIMVPRITFLSLDNRIVTTAEWDDAKPTLIPGVDYLIIPRKQFTPSILFRKREDRCLIPMSKAKALFSQYHADDFAMPAYKLDYPTPPDPLKKFVKRLPPTSNKLRPISVDSILDEELITKHRNVSKI